VFDTLFLTSVLVPLTIGYAVIKHRVIDVSFVVNRALVYGALTTLLVGMFSVIDWFFVDYLRLARLGTIAEVAAVVGFGLWFKGLHMRVDSFIDATFFRQRHAAERQLARNAAALPFATTTQIVATALVKEPVRALGLASAALFWRNKDGVYVREELEGWSAADIQRLDDSDGHFLMLLQAENGPVSLYDHPWRAHGVPSGPAYPVLALPIIVRRELVAIVLYGAHIHGEPLDPDEIKAIAGLASAAAAATIISRLTRCGRRSRYCAASWQRHRYSLLEMPSLVDPRSTATSPCAWADADCLKISVPHKTSAATRMPPHVFALRVVNLDLR